MNVVQLEGLEAFTEIGRGGFGVVYRATETELNRTVAVKLLGKASADLARKRLDRERRAMGVLSGHPNIVTIYRSGITDGCPFMVMEYLAGGSLDERLEEMGAIPWRDVIDIGIDLCGAVEAAHRAGVLHRDIKPANILLTETGVPKLGDFGIADVDSVSQTSGVMKATVAHAPPEVLRGESTDARADVYSLASTLYQMISGSPAFVRPTDTSPVPVMMRITSEPVPDLPPSLVPWGVTQCLQQAMAKEPAHRPPTAAHFAGLLAAAVNSSGLIGDMGAGDVGIDHPFDPPFDHAVGRHAVGRALDHALDHGEPPVTTSSPQQTGDINPGDGTSDPIQSLASPHPGVPPHGTSGEPSPEVWAPPAGYAAASPSRATPTQASTPVGTALWALLAGVATALVLIVAAVAILNRPDEPGNQVVADQTSTGQPNSEGQPIDPGSPTTAATGATEPGGSAAGTPSGSADDSVYTPPTDEPAADGGAGADGEAGNEAADGGAADDDTTLDSYLAPDPTTVDGRIEAFHRLAEGTLDTTSFGDYASYENLADPSGAVSVSVPTGWDDRLNFGEDTGVGVQAGTNITGTEAGLAHPGLGIFLYDKAFLGLGTTDALLDVIGANDLGCTYEPRVEFDHPLFSGSYQILHSCSAADPELMSMQMIGELKENSGYFLQITVVIVDADDLTAGQVALDTASISLAQL